MSPEPPLAVYRPHLPGLWRELGCLGVCVLPALAAPPLLLVDGRRALAALAMSLLMSPLPLILAHMHLGGAMRRVEVRRSGLVLWTLRGARHAVRWRELARVEREGDAERWIGAVLHLRDGRRLRLTRLLGGGQALAFLAQHGAEAGRYPAGYEAAARWAWPAAWGD